MKRQATTRDEGIGREKRDGGRKSGLVRRKETEKIAIKTHPLSAEVADGRGPI